MINTLRYAGYVVHSMNNNSGFDRYYQPTVFQGLALSDNEILNHAKKDSFAEAFYDVALHYGNESIVAFTPKIMTHKAILQEILQFKGKDIIFTDKYNSNTNLENVHNIIYPNYMTTNTNFFKNAGRDFTYFVTSNASRDLVITSGTWTIDNLRAKYPSTIDYVTQSGNNALSGFLIKKNIIIGQGAELDITNHRVYLKSSSLEHSDFPVHIAIEGGKAKISSSTVTSWDPVLKGPDPNPFHPRPFIIAINGGKMNILNSTIRNLGFSIGGISDPRFAVAAISYYNTGNFIIANSTIAFNYYGFYSNNANNFEIVHNNIYSQTKYGLDPHTMSKNFIVAFNHIHDNGNQGVICSIECENLTITNNLVDHNVEGIGLHWLTNSSLVKDNIVKFNQKYGIFIQKHSFNNTVKNNTVIGNGNGIGMFDGSKNNNVVFNTISDNLGNSITVAPDSQPNVIKENIYSQPNLKDH
jgi:parallel beta-helix repeat protein